MKWYRLAAEQGHASAIREIKKSRYQIFLPELEKERRLAAEKAEELRLAAEKAKEERRIAKAKAKEERRIAEARADIIRHFQPECAAFGFEVSSNQMAACMFDLYKIEQGKEQKRGVALERAKQNRAVIDAGNSNAAARTAQIEAQNRLVREQLKEQQRQREINELNGLLELGKQGLEMMQPPKPALTCTYNPSNQTTTCY